MSSGEGVQRHALRMHGVSKRYGTTQAVDNLHLTVERGTTYGLLGPNGAGKSTTIRMLMGLAEPDDGDIEILGHGIQRRTIELKRRIGYVPELHNLYSWMRVRKLIDFVASLYPAWDHELAEQLLDLFALPEAKKVSHLSKGMTAKLGLLLSICPRPDLLILDEPTSGLDPLVRDEFLDGVLSTQAQEGRTILFSSHHVDDVERLADVVGIMSGGKLIVEEQLASLHDRVKLMRAVIEDGTLPGWIPEEALWSEVNRREWNVLLRPYHPGLVEEIASRNSVTSHEVIDVSFESIFKQTIRGRRESADRVQGVA